MLLKPPKFSDDIRDFPGVVTHLKDVTSSYRKTFNFLYQLISTIKSAAYNKFR